MKTYFTTCQSIIGELLLSSDGEALTGLAMEIQRYAPLRTHAWIEAPELPLLERAVAQINQYFAGTLTSFDLPLAMHGTEFQRRVWDELTRIPFGHTISYGELAARLGNPKASRAVGLANGHNPVSIIVPCHRVIGASGSLTGYGGGLERKQTLLALEKGVLGGLGSTVGMESKQGVLALDETLS